MLPADGMNYAQPLAQRSFLKEVNRLVEEMIGNEVVKTSESPWLSPIAVIKKIDGGMRLCIDKRKL
ncbi:Transposon Ty3-G Gag-Pol polyprotein, partial [Taenia solium]